MFRYMFDPIEMCVYEFLISGQQKALFEDEGTSDLLCISRIYADESGIRPKLSDKKDWEIIGTPLIMHEKDLSYTDKIPIQELNSAMSMKIQRLRTEADKLEKSKRALFLKK